MKAPFMAGPERIEAIGMFIICFSTLENTIRFLLGIILKLDQDTIDLVTRSYDFTTLCNVTKAVAKTKNVTPFEVDTLEKLLNQSMKINETRIRVAHGTWNDDGAVHMSRSSLVAQTYFTKVDEIIETYQHAIDVTVAINEITKKTFDALRIGEMS